MILQLFIPGVPKNANARNQWAAFSSNSDRQKFRRLARAIATRASGPWEAPDFTHITARQISPVKRRRDPTGLAERLKGILDGLVDAAILPDDDEDHIELTLAKSARGPVAGIELTLWEPCPPKTS